MSYTLIIAEKPSAAKSIADALADGKPKKLGDKAAWYEFTRDGKDFVTVPAVGHLFTLKQKGKGWEYPIFDVEWIPTFQANKFAKFTEPYFRNIEALAKDAGDVIIATDYDDEGEVIGYNILKFILGRKDAARLKFSTMTKEELLDSYAHPTKLNKNLIEAGLARHYLDFYWGISFTRALTLAVKASAKRFRIVSTGRVQGPVLHMLAKHEKQIKAFKPVPFWEIEMHVQIGKQEMVAEYGRKINDKKEAEAATKKADVKTAIVKDITKKIMTQAPPKPYNTTSMLADIYRYFGYSPQQGLSIAETLYQSGMISYPRTSSEKLPKDINYKKIITQLGKQKNYEKDAKQLLAGELKPEEGSKTDAAHPAVYPTGVYKKIGDKQAKVYDLIVRRFLAVFGQPAKRESNRITLDANGVFFSLNGKKTIEAGWTSLYGKYAQREEIILPNIKIGDKIPVKKVELLSKETQPPARFSQGSVLKEMEQKNLGTKCLTGDCKIITPDSSDVSLADLWMASTPFGYEDNVEIRKLNTPTTVSLNETNTNIEFKKPKLISRRKLEKNEKLLSIKTKGGELKATSGHPIYLYKDGSIVLEEAVKACKGDKLVSVISRNKSGELLADKSWFLERKFKNRNGMLVSRFSGKNAMGIMEDKLPIKWSSDLAWILGYFYGDGSYNSPEYNGSHQLYFTTIEKKALNLLKARIKRVFGVEPKAYLVKNDSQYKVQCNSAMAALMSDLFPSIAKKKKFEIPDDFIGDFLRGFFDADGNVHLRATGKVRINGTEAIGHGVPRIKITLARRDLIVWISELLSKLGIVVNIHEGKSKLKEKYFECFTILVGGRERVDRFAWKVGFDVDHKKYTLYKGLLSDSLQYKILRTSYSIVLALHKENLDAPALKNIMNCSAYDVEIALKRLVKMGVIKRKRLSPYSKPPNRVIYELKNKDYHFHALKSAYEHIGGEFYAAEVQEIKDITKPGEFVYDISVSPDSPNFITNGAVLVHNSTRAQILQILYNRGYLLGRSIEVTELGEQLSNILEKNIPDVISEKLTGHFEEMTESIENGKAKRDDVLEEAKRKIEKICVAFKKKEKKIGDELTAAVIATQDKQSKLGTCLKCGGTLKVHKNWRTGKRFVGCSGYPKGCRVGFPLPREGVITSTGKNCEECKLPIIQVQKAGARPFRMCLDPLCVTKKDWLDKNKLKQVQAESRRSSKEAAKLVCTICNKSFKTKRALTLHAKTHETVAKARAAAK